MFYKTITVLLIAFCLMSATPALADMFGGGDQTGPYLGMEYGEATGLGKADVRLTAAWIIYLVMGLLGTVSVVLIVYAGFKWMTAGGNEEQVTGAKKILYTAIIGLVIILSAYSIVRFILPNLFRATTGNLYEVEHPEDLY